LLRSCGHRKMYAMAIVFGSAGVMALDTAIDG
jgi:hypothetical protein